MLQGKQKRPPGLYALVTAIVFQGLSGIAGGIGLVADPTGEALRIPADWLQGSPFRDYLVPGLVLLLVLGLLPLVAVYGLWTRQRWSRPAALALSVALIVWIGVEISVIGYHARPPLQLIYGSLGIVMLVLALLPSVRRHVTDREQVG